MIFIYQHEFLDEEFDDFVLHINRLEPYLYFRNLCNIYSFIYNARLCRDRVLKLRFMKSVIERWKFEREIGKDYSRNLPNDID